MSKQISALSGRIDDMLEEIRRYNAEAREGQARKNPEPPKKKTPREADSTAKQQPAANATTSTSPAAQIQPQKPVQQHALAPDSAETEKKKRGYTTRRPDTGKSYAAEWSAAHTPADLPALPTPPPAEQQQEDEDEKKKQQGHGHGGTRHGRDGGGGPGMSDR